MGNHPRSKESGWTLCSWESSHGAGLIFLFMLNGAGHSALSSDKVEVSSSIQLLEFGVAETKSVSIICTTKVHRVGDTVDFFIHMLLLVLSGVQM